MRIQTANVVCVSDQNKDRLVTYPTKSGDLGVGYLVGQGDTAVVLLHQAGGGLCLWTGTADKYAAKGLRAFAIDIRSDTRAQDTVDAVAYLRANGAKRVFLVGASLGATTALIAAASAQPAVDGVVSLSGPVLTDGMDAAPAITSLTMPIVFAAGDNEGNFTDDAKKLHSGCASRQKRLILLPTSDHGFYLMSRGMDDFVQQFVADPVAALKLTV